MTTFDAFAFCQILPGNKTIQKNKQNHNPRSDPQTNAQKSWFGQKSNVGENPMTNGPAWIASFGSRPQRFVNVVVHVQVAQLKPWVIFVGARASLRDCKSRSTFRSQLPSPQPTPPPPLPAEPHPQPPTSSANEDETVFWYGRPLRALPSSDAVPTPSDSEFPDGWR